MIMPFRSPRARCPAALGWFATLLAAVASTPTLIPAEGGEMDRFQTAATAAAAARFGFPLLEVRRDPFVPFSADQTSVAASGDESTFALPPNDAANGFPTGVPRTGSRSHLARDHRWNRAEGIGRHCGPADPRERRFAAVSVQPSSQFKRTASCLRTARPSFLGRASTMRAFHAIALVFCTVFACRADANAATNLLTIDVRDVDISDVIALLAAESGVNVITDGSVKPERVTVHLHGVTFQEALRPSPTHTHYRSDPRKGFWWLGRPKR